MAKTQEELDQLKAEYETLKTKLQELTEDELKKVTGGLDDGDNISRVKGLISQIISILSSIENDVVVQTAIQNFNSAINSLDSGSLQSAKLCFVTAFETFGGIASFYESIYNSIADIYYEVMFAMNWL